MQIKNSTAKYFQLFYLECQSVCICIIVLSLFLLKKRLDMSYHGEARFMCYLSVLFKMCF